MRRDDSAPWGVRVLDPGDSVAGTGFLISDNLVLTCAHVVQAAMDMGYARDRPNGYVRLDLPAFQQQRQAEVLPGGWFPGEPGARGDLAVLALHGPAVRVKPPTLQISEALPPGARILFYGYSYRSDTGAWDSAELEADGGVPHRWRWLTADPADETGQGFSGAAAVAAETGEVVGMLVAQRRGPARQAVGMLPVERIANCWPPLASYVPALATEALSFGTPGDIPLLVRDAGTIVDALMAVPDLRDQKLRSSYIDALATRMGIGPDLHRFDDARRDLWSLTSWCAGIPGSFQALLDVVREFQPGSLEADVLKERIDHVVAPPLLTTGERGELVRLLGDAQHEDLGEIYRSVAGPPRSLVDSDPDDPAVIVRALEETVVPQQGVPAIAEFVARVAENEPHHYAQREMWQWIERFSQRIGVEQPQRTDVKRQAIHQESTAQLPAYLTFQLDEDGIDATRYLLTAWRQAPGQSPETFYCEDEALSLTEARDKIGELIGSAGDSMRAGASPLLIEFALPTPLLGIPVHEWTITTRSHPAALPIGSIFPVVIRCVDRVRDRRLRLPWLQEWSRLSRDPRAGAPHVVSGELPAIHAALEAGFPFIIWRRRGADAAETADLLGPLIRGPVTRDWVWQVPLMVRGLRAAAAANPQDSPERAVDDLSLIWDDPSRIPGQPVPLNVPELAER